MRFLLLLIGILFMSMANALDFEISSSAFKENETIPTQYTCSGKDVSPPFSWTTASEKTQSFALICSDPDAPGGTWYHWVLYNIPATVKDMAENQLPIGSVVGKNSWGRATYNGPCPPPGKPHHYIFTLYALDTKLNLISADAETLQKNMKGHVLQSAKITGIFAR